MNLDTFIKKTPRPVLVVGVLILAIIFFVLNDPLHDECEIQISNFEKKMKGILTNTRTKTKKIQFAQLDEYWKNRCKEGNSIGSCDEYFEGLRFVTNELRLVNDKCQVKYGEENSKFLKHIGQALQIMALVAWGDKPPAGVSERFGWLNEAHMRTFCYLKKTFILLNDEESFISLREKIYREYPGPWPKKLDVDKFSVSNSDSKTDKDKTENDEAGIDKLIDENRPRAYKTPSNPSGTLLKEQIYERSIFSIRCDSYM